MKSNHLDEYKIQEFVLLNTNCDVEIIEHILHCDTCKIKVDQYKMLLEGIRQQEKPSFEFDLADLVMKQLPQPKPISSVDNAFIYFTSLLVILLGAAAFYFFRIYLSSSLPNIAPMLNYLIFTTLMSLFVFLCIDMFMKYQKQIKVLNYQ